MHWLLHRVNGSYEALSGGSSSEAMEDFTGGICETFNFKKDGVPSNMFNVVKKAHERLSLMACSIEVDIQRMTFAWFNYLI